MTESNVTFDNQDTTEQTVNVDITKYTKVDNLDEDPQIASQQWVCVSFLSPEGVYNCRVRGVKVRGVFATRQLAEEHAEKLRGIDKYFHIFVGEVGKWLPWDPELDDVPEQKHGDERLEKLLDSQRKNNLRDLNVLAGKKKEMVETSQVNHNKRIADSIKNAKSGSTETTQSEKPIRVRNDHNPQAIRENLKKKLEAKRAAKDKTEQSDLQLREELVKKEAERLKKLDETLVDDKNKLKTIDDNMAKIKSYMQKYKDNKSNSSS